MAMNEIIKSAVEPHLAKWDANESGTAIRRTLIQPLRIRFRIDWTKVGEPCDWWPESGFRSEEAALGFVPLRSGAWSFDRASGEQSGESWW